MTDVVAVIPARLNSRRFPGKVIYPYRGRPLLAFILEEIKRAKTVSRVLVATDSPEVSRAVEPMGYETVRTSSRHQTGSDRVAEAVEKTGGRLIINIQADNFGVKARVLDNVVAKLRQDRRTAFATLAYRLTEDDELFNPNVVKVVLSKDGQGLWFSRLPIPYLRDATGRHCTRQHRFYGHIGIYFFRRAGLRRYARWRRTAAEKAESLEQLRIVENGARIRVFTTSMRPVAVDTPEDVNNLRKLYG